MSFSAPRDVIQISLGSSANAVTAHSLNLQGLAATDHGVAPEGGVSLEGPELATCDPTTTHYVEHHHWVPRVLFVDEPTRFFVSPHVSQQLNLFQQQQQQQQACSRFNQEFQLLSSFSPFAIQPLDPALSLQHSEPQTWSAQFFQTSSTLAYSAHSRYYHGSESYKKQQSFPSYQASSDNPRHVDWDNLGDESEEQDQTYEVESLLHRQLRLQREKGIWQHDTMQPLEEKLQQMVSGMDDLSHRSDQVSSPSSPDIAQTVPTENLHWMDYWMPPYSSRSQVSLQYSRQSHLMPHWDSYHLGKESDDSGALREWKEDVLSDRLRHLLEACDACQGIILTTQGHGIYAGLTTALLQELQEETKSAIRMVFHVNNPMDDKTEHENDKDGNKDLSQTNWHNGDSHDGWQPGHVKRLRRNMSTGLALHDFAQNAHAVLPLQLPSVQSDGTSSSLFHASARVAMALETCTLPIRLNGSAYAKSDPSRRLRRPRYQIGLLNAPFFGQGGGDSPWGSTALRLSMSEYLMCLQPSNQYKILELDALLPRRPAPKACKVESSSTSLNSDQLWQALIQGTSIERDTRMRERGRDASRYRLRDVAPGAWMQDATYNKLQHPEKGLLTSLSPTSGKVTDRSLHHHFALSTAVRPVMSNEDSALSNYVTALVQGMGIRYRPERSMSTVANQTIGKLTQAGSYGAGAYWRSLLSGPDSDFLDQPVVSVLGNSTRSYFHIDHVASGMKFVMGPRYRGFYQRDVMNGVLPEAEDCEEALENCLNLRDIYLPPDGSGLVDEHDGDIEY